MEMDAETAEISRFERFPPNSSQSPTHYHKATAYCGDVPSLHFGEVCSSMVMNDAEVPQSSGDEVASRNWLCSYGGASDIY
jgi:hypothetical protein